MKKNVTKFSRLFMMAFMLIVLLTAAAANSVAVAEEAVPQTREYIIRPLTDFSITVKAAAHRLLTEA